MTASRPPLHPQTGMCVPLSPTDRKDEARKEGSFFSRCYFAPKSVIFDWNFPREEKREAETGRKRTVLGIEFYLSLATHTVRDARQKETAIPSS